MVSRRWTWLLVLLTLPVLGGAGYSAARHLTARHRLASAREALARGDFAAAATHLGYCLDIWPDRADVHLLAAQAARRAEDYDGAERHLDRCQALQGVPEAVTFEWNLLRAQRGDLSPAVEGYLLSFRQNPAVDQSLILEALTQGYWKARRLVEARRCAEQLLRCQPDHAQAHVWHGEILERFQEFTLALQAYRRAVTLAPDAVYSRLSLAELLLDRARPAEALEQFEILAGQLPGNAAVRLGMARCRRGLGQVAEARRLLDALLAEMPREGLVLSERGRLALETGEPAEAEPWLRQAAAQRTGDQSVAYALLQALEQLGRKDEAAQARARLEAIDADQKRLKELSQKLARGPATPDLRHEMGVLYLRLGQDAEGLSWLQGALRDAPLHGPTHRTLADYYERQGQAARAAQHRRRAGQAETGSP